MKRIVAAIVVLGTALTVAACGSASDSQESAGSGEKAESVTEGNAGGDGEKGDGEIYEMSIAHLDPSGPIYDGWEYMKEILEERSGGRIKVTIYPNKQISSSDTENAEKVQQNIVQMSSVPTSALTSLAAIDGYKILDCPYLFLNGDELNTFLDSDIMDNLGKQLTEKTGIKPYVGFSIGWQRVSNKKGPAVVPSDLEGLKIRTMTSDLLMAAVNSWGASATPLNFGEVFTGLQQGAIDGVMTTSTLHVTERYYEVEKYITCTDAVPNVHIPIVNGSWYDSLPEDLQTVFDECVVDYIGEVRELENAAEEESLAELEKNGMTVTVLSDEEKQAWIDAADGVLDEYKGEIGEDIVNQVLELLGKK